MLHICSGPADPAWADSRLFTAAGEHLTAAPDGSPLGSLLVGRDTVEVGNLQRAAANAEMARALLEPQTWAAEVRWEGVTFDLSRPLDVAVWRLAVTMSRSGAGVSPHPHEVIGGQRQVTEVR